MGQEFQPTTITESDRSEFSERLQRETQLLKSWFSENKFSVQENPTCGLELEAWLIDEDYLPNPCNEEFLREMNHELIVHELSQFNFELNVTPGTLNKNIFTKLKNEIESLLKQSSEAAKKVNSRQLLIGILPMVRENMLTLQYMSNSNRYKALNDQLFLLRKGEPLNINIQGKEQLQFTQEDVMLEAAATSLQVHLQVNQEDAAQIYNASLICSAPLVAISANSPFLYGKQLWEESRIPVFEQSINLDSFENKSSKIVNRVGFGTNYLKSCFFEAFLENYEDFPPLLPILFEDSEDKLSHLKLHNGTVWRWNRPLIGVNADGSPHLRIEQRVMPAGPSTVDTVANMALYLGLAKSLAKADNLTSGFPFQDAKANFYNAAKFGLRAEINWFGRKVTLQELILNELIDKAKEELIHLGVYQVEVDYLMGIIRSRALSGQTGAKWQRSYVEVNGKDFQGLSEKYYSWQQTGKPVHEWTI